MRSGRRLGIFGFAWAVIVLTTCSAWAQVAAGTVSGTIKDAQGAVLVGASVVLVDSGRGTTSAPTLTDGRGDFVFVTVAPGTYAIEVSLPGAKTLRHDGVSVGAGERVSVGTVAMGPDGRAENLRTEAPAIQLQSGERAVMVGTDSVSSLPIANRNYMALALLSSGVAQDDKSTLDQSPATSNPTLARNDRPGGGVDRDGPLLQLNVEAIGEMRVLTSAYQAEYGGMNAVQIIAATKSGTNRFHGAAYDIERNSAWNPNSQVNILNGDPKQVSRARNWGFTIGGPAGRAGGDNKLFFFFAQEFSPLSSGNDVSRFRMPTDRERSGDFSQSTDNNGTLYNLIKDPDIAGGICTAANTSGCFADGGVLGKIPANRLYPLGLNILSMFPKPTIAAPGTNAYNYEVTRPVERILAWEPALRFDYQATQFLRASVQYASWAQRSQTINGSLPGFNDAKMQRAPVTNLTFALNYTLTPTMFLEATYSHSRNELAGCTQGQSGSGPVFCTQGVPMSSSASLSGSGLTGLPFLFPNATVLSSGDYAADALNELQPALWDATTLRMSKVPIFSWGNRIANAPPAIGFPGWLSRTSAHDLSITFTKVTGSHTTKMGFFARRANKAEQTSNAAFGSVSFGQDAPGTNPFDTSFGFANTAIGTFSSFAQAQQYVEAHSVQDSRAAFIQDNWRLNGHLTLDLGVRVVNEQAPRDQRGQASNFLLDAWHPLAAPAFYRPGCTIALAPGAACPLANRQAVDSRNGTFLGPNTSAAIGTLVPGSGDALNGLFRAGQLDLPAATYSTPLLALAPRFEIAYDLSTSQRAVLHGGGGLYFDRPNSTTFSSGINNPPTSNTVTIRYAQLQAIGPGGLPTSGAPALAAFPEHLKLPVSAQWDGGIRLALPWASSLDVSYVGLHSYNTFQAVNINSIDFGTAFLENQQDGTLGTNSMAGAAALSADLIRPIRGYGSILEQLNRGWRTSHSVQISLQRRFKNGVQFNVSDTLGVVDKQQAAARLEHAADGTWSYRSDQAAADVLLGDNHPQRHVMNASVVWDLPDIRSDQAFLRALGAVANDWQFSSVWSGATGAAYAISFNYQNGGASSNLTGSPDYPARVVIAGDTGSGCNTDDVYRQFKATAFQGAPVRSVGLDSGNGYLRGCFSSTLDLAIARSIRLGSGRSVQLRLDAFNATNAARITGRNSTINFASPDDPTTITNLPFDAAGQLIDSRALPRGAGFGVVNNYQSPRALQMQLRFSF